MPQSYPATNVIGAEAEKAWLQLLKGDLSPSPLWSLQWSVTVCMADFKQGLCV